MAIVGVGHGDVTATETEPTAPPHVSPIDPREAAAYERILDRLTWDGGDFLSADVLEKLTPADVIANVRALKPLLAQHMAEAERLQRPVREVWAAIRRSGYFYLILPKQFGGLEASFDEMLDATFALCEADPATGWLAAFCVMNPRSVAGFPEAVQRELFGDGRYAVVTSLLAPFGAAERVEGGYRVSGLWHWGTTIQLSDWVSVTAMVETEEHGRTSGAFLLPAREATILKSWDAAGLIATGTHKVLVENVFVPEHRATPFSMMTPEWPQTVRKRFTYPLFLGDMAPSLSMTIAIPIIGAARGALAHCRDHLAQHVKRGDDDTDSSRQSAQIRLAKAAGMISAAELFLRDAARIIYGAVHEPQATRETIGLIERGRIAYASQLAREAVLLLVESAGTSIYYAKSPIQQFVRDILVGATHVAVDADMNLENAGRALLGLKARRAQKPRLA